MVLHLERKFIGLTETFIANQINVVNTMQHSVFTVKYRAHLNTDATVYYPPRRALFDTKILRRSHKKFFQEHIRAIRPRIIHAHFLTDAAFFHPLTKRFKVPKICSAYGYDVSSFPHKNKWLADKMYTRIFDEYDLFLAMSEDMKSDMVSLGCNAHKIRVHYHGIFTKQFDLQREHVPKPNSLNLLTIASLEPKKGHFDVLEALVDINKSNQCLGLKYTVVGSGSLEESLKNFVRENHLGELVRFIPAVKHGKIFNELLSEADIFVHPSCTTKTGNKEGIPGAIVEAMASGLPVITTYHAGIPTIIEHGKSGFLVKENDRNGIAENILKLYEQSGLRKTVGLEAKKYAQENLDLYKKAVDLEKFYKSTIEKYSLNLVP